MIRKFVAFSFGGWLAAAVSIITLPVVTALLRPEEFGKASMFSLAVGFGAQFAQVGTDQAYARYFFAAERKGTSRDLLRAALAVPILLSLLCAAVIVILENRIGRLLFDAPNLLATRLLAAGVVLTVIERYSTLALRMKQQGASYSALRLVGAFVTFLVTYGYARLVSADFVALCVAQTTSVLVTLVLGVAFSSAEWSLGPVDRAQLRQALAYGLPFVPAFVVIWLFEGMGRIMLRHLADFAELGLFSAAFRFVSLLTLIQASFSTFWLPVAFEMMEKDPKMARMKFSIAITRAIPILLSAGLCILMGKELVITLFASDYRDAIAIMPFLLLVPIMYALSEISIGCISFSNKNYWHLIIAAVSLAANVGINGLLIPSIGARGAALGAGFSYILFFALRLHVSRKLFPFEVDSRRIWLGVSAFCVTCFAHTFWSESPLSYFLAIGALLYILNLYWPETTRMATIIKSRIHL